MHAKHIYLIKHGETEENKRGIHQGQGVGGRLSMQGQDDVRTVGECLAEAGTTVDQMLVSPMSRTRESATLLTAALAPGHVRLDERLAAKNSGHLAGRPRDLAVTEAARHRVSIHQLRTPGGESSEDVQARYMSLWRDITTTTAQTTVVVGHGGGIACLLLRLTGHGFDRYLDFVPGSADTTWVEVIDGTPHIRCLNAAPGELHGHLTPHTAR